MIIGGVCRAAHRLSLRRSGSLAVTTQFAASQLLGSIGRVHVSVAALALSLAMMFSVSIMIASFRTTVVYWVGQTLHADLFVKAATLESGAGDATLSSGSSSACGRRT